MAAGDGSRDDAITRLLACSDPHALLHTLVSIGLSDLGARGGAVYLLQDDGWLRLAAATGVDEAVLERHRIVPPDHDLPVAQVVRTRRPMYVPTEAGRMAFPSLREMHNGHISFAALPLMVDQRVLGSIFIGLTRPWALSDADQAALAAMVGVCAHRLEHLLTQGQAGETRDIRFDRAVRMLDARTRAARLEMAMAVTDTGAWEWEFASGTLLWDEQTCRIAGVDPGAFDERAETYFSSLHPDDVGMVQAAVAEAIASRGEYHTVHRLIRPDGEARWVDGRGRVLTDSQGNPVRMVGITFDCTEQHRREELERAQEEARRARERFMLTLTRTLSQAATVDEVVEVLTGTALPALGADALVLHLDDGGHLRLAGAAGYGDAARERLRTLDRSARSPMARALEAGSPLFLETPEAYAAAFSGTALPESGAETQRRLGADRETRKAPRPMDPSAPWAPPARGRARREGEEGGPLLPEGGQGRRVEAELDPTGEPQQKSWAVLPLTAADQPVGTCLIAFHRIRRFTADDRTLYTALAGILAQSLERARLFDLGRRRMTELQRVMLPRRLPELPGLAIAARYLPGSEGMEVGGDWYDVLPLRDGRVGLVIGDVQGHSTRAAAVMGQLRIALRAYAAEGHDPATLMSSTNRLLCGLDTEYFATCCYLEFDPADGTVRAVRAGHPQPLLLSPDGKAAELECAGGLPLGIDAAEEYPVTKVVLPPGALLLLHTDGLVESRDRSYSDAVDELAVLLCHWAASPDGSGTADPTAAHVRQSVHRLADRVAAPAAARATREDDIALLVVRRIPDPGAAPPVTADWQVTAGDLRGLADARRSLRRQLLQWGLADLADDAELLAAELLSNAVLHAGGDVELNARLDGAVLRVEVLDGSRHRPRLVPGTEPGSAESVCTEPGDTAPGIAEPGSAEPGSAEPRQADGAWIPMSGRGVRLVDACAERWGWEPLGDRKAVWFELRAGDGPARARAGHQAEL